MKMRVLLLVAAAGAAVVGCDRNRDDDRYGRDTEYRSNTTYNDNTYRTNTTNRNMDTRSDTAIRSDYRDTTATRTDMNRSTTNWQSDQQNRQQFGTQTNNQQNNNTAIRAMDKDFITQAASDGMKEVEMGRLGVRQASNEQVKQFAQKMIDDHGKANDELMTLARSKNVDVSTQMPQDHKSMVEKFNQLNGADFDKQYIDHMVQDHQKAVDLFDRQARQGEDAQVRAFAARTLPTLRQHLQQAKELQQTIGGTDLGTPRRTPTTPTTTPGNTNPNNPNQPINPLSDVPTQPNQPATDPNNPTPTNPTTPPGGG